MSGSRDRAVQRIHLSALLLIFSLVWAGLLVLEGVNVTPAFFSPLSKVIGIGVLLLSAFDLWLWRVPVLHGWFVKRPYLRGTWRVTFQTSWRNPETGQIPGPITGFMVVRQTYTNLTMTLLTQESSSQFVADELAVAPDGSFVVFAVYHNEPKVQVRHRSEIHYGALKLSVRGTPATSMEGTYWTDRLTRGDIRLTERRKGIFDDFESASAEFGLRQRGQG